MFRGVHAIFIQALVVFGFFLFRFILCINGDYWHVQLVQA